MKHTSPSTHSRAPARRRLASSLGALVGAAVVVLTPGAARADTSCAHDSDCVKGFICQTSSTEACSNIACAPGEECDLPACTPSTVSECVPGPCTTDNDCADGMVCFAESDGEACSTPAQPPCPKGAECPVAAVDAGSSCTSTTVKECVPRYVPPCNADADCGAGFTCVADQECGCSGSAGSGAVSPPGTPVVGPDDSAPAVDAGVSTPNCSCTTLSTSHCQANVIPCSVSGDCPSQWSCAPSPSAVSGGCAVGVSVDGSTTTTDCSNMVVTTPTQNVCEPPYSDLDLGGGATELSGAGSTSATDTSGTAPTASPASGSASGGSSQGGCAVASGRSEAGAGGWLALFGLAAFARRRRSAR